MFVSFLSHFSHIFSHFSQDDPGKAYAYVVDRAPTPDVVMQVWNVWECALTSPIESGKWFSRPAFKVVPIAPQTEVAQLLEEQALASESSMEESTDAKVVSTSTLAQSAVPKASNTDLL